MSVLTFPIKGDGEALNNVEGGKLFSLKRTVDCSKNNVDSGDVVKLLEVPANTLVKEVVANVRTEEGGTLAIDVGDYARDGDAATDADRYLDANDLDGNSEGAYKTSTANDNGPTAGGKFYTDDSEYIGAAFGNDADTAVIDFHIICVKCT